ncbi:MAG: hypothetical protein R6V85_08075, partial [Polyangia bacterium]
GYKVESRWPLEWLSIEPLQGQVAAGEPTGVTLTWDEAAFQGEPGSGEWNRLYFVTPGGLSRRVYTELWSVPPAADADADADADTDADSDVDTDQDSTSGGGGGSGCGATPPGASRGPLRELLGIL